MSPYPDHYEYEVESSIRIVPVTRGVTCDNGARLFVVGVELWPDFSFVHYAMLRVDEPRPGYISPHPDFLGLELSMTDEFGHTYRPEHLNSGGSSSPVGGVFQRSGEMFEPIRREARTLTIVPANATWKGWTLSSGEPGIVVQLPD